MLGESVMKGLCCIFKRGVKLTHHLLVPRSRMVELNFHALHVFMAYCLIA
jgi:hypothetical protein